MSQYKPETKETLLQTHYLLVSTLVSLKNLFKMFLYFWLNINHSTWTLLFFFPGDKKIESTCEKFSVKDKKGRERLSITDGHVQLYRNEFVHKGQFYKYSTLELNISAVFMKDIKHIYVTKMDYRYKNTD